LLIRLPPQVGLAAVGSTENSALSVEHREWFGHLWRCPSAVESIAARSGERRTAGPHLDPESVMMYQLVMVPTQQDQVVEIREPTSRPMENVVGIDEASLRATGEGAAAISLAEGSALRAVGRSGRSTDPERLVGLAHQHRQHAVAGDATDRVGIEPNPCLGEIAVAAVGVSRQRVEIHVDLDAVVAARSIGHPFVVDAVQHLVAHSAKSFDGGAHVVVTVAEPACCRQCSLVGRAVFGI
jgi:hypothetical protein